MLQAMNTGHDGPPPPMPMGRDLLSRPEVMVLIRGRAAVTAVREQIAAAVDLIVTSRFSCGARRVTHCRSHRHDAGVISTQESSAMSHALDAGDSGGGQIPVLRVVRRQRGPIHPARAGVGEGVGDGVPSSACACFGCPRVRRCGPAPADFRREAIDAPGRSPIFHLRGTRAAAGSASLRWRLRRVALPRARPAGLSGMFASPRSAALARRYLRGIGAQLPSDVDARGRCAPPRSRRARSDCGSRPARPQLALVMRRHRVGTARRGLRDGQRCPECSCSSPR